MASLWLQINDSISACCTQPKYHGSVATKYDENLVKNHFYDVSKGWISNGCRDVKEIAGLVKEKCIFDATKFTRSLRTNRNKR